MTEFVAPTRDYTFSRLLKNRSKARKCLPEDFTVVTDTCAYLDPFANDTTATKRSTNGKFNLFKKIGKWTTSGIGTSNRTSLDNMELDVELADGSTDRMPDGSGALSFGSSFSSSSKSTEHDKPDVPHPAERDLARGFSLGSGFDKASDEEKIGRTANEWKLGQAKSNLAPLSSANIEKLATSQFGNSGIACGSAIGNVHRWVRGDAWMSVKDEEPYDHGDHVESTDGSRTLGVENCRILSTPLLPLGPERNNLYTEG